MATQTPTIRMRTSILSEAPPMWLRASQDFPSNPDDDMPYIGEVRMFAGALPVKWLNLSSGPVSRLTYAELFAYLGTTWGPGNGTTTFDLPPSQRIPIAAGAKVGLTTRTLAATGGAESVTLTGAQSGIQGGISLTVTDPGHVHAIGSLAMPSHTHTLSSGGVTINDPGHFHAGSGSIFLGPSAGTEYESAAGDKGADFASTSTDTTGITASLTGDSGATTAPISTGDTSSATTGITVETVATAAADATPLLNPFAVYNFGIYANA